MTTIGDLSPNMAQKVRVSILDGDTFISGPYCGTEVETVEVRDGIDPRFSNKRVQVSFYRHELHARVSVGGFLTRRLPLDHPVIIKEAE